MGLHKVIVFVCVALCYRTNSVCGNHQSTWSIEQNEGLDDLYLQTQSTAPVTPEYDLVPTVCGEIKSIDSYKYIMLTREGDNFRSKIRGQLTEVENAPIYVTEFGSRRYDLRANDSPTPLSVDLYTCTDDGSVRKHLLSHGYKRDSLFFLFALNGNTNEAELRALVRRNSDSSENPTPIQTTEVEKPSEKPNVEISALDNPLCKLSRIHKIKVCALLLNTPYYTNKFTLWPVPANFDPQCKRVVVESEGALGRTERLALPCWVRPISNPWIKILFMPNSPSAPLYISVNYRNFEVKTMRTVLQGDEYDTVRFEANFTDLFVKDLFYIFEEAAAKTKWLHDKMKGGQSSGRDEDQGVSDNINDSQDVVSVTPNTMDADVQGAPVSSTHTTDVKN